MSFGYKRKSEKAEKGKIITGQGTGISDDIKKSVPSGSYIMPADSTSKIGEDNLKNMGHPKSVNLSNGEFEIPPDQVFKIGVQTLEQLKGQTHTPVDQPQLQFTDGEKKPQLFFANGGLIPFDEKNEIRRPNVQTEVNRMKTISGVTGNVSPPGLPQPNSTITSAPTPSTGLGAKMLNTAKGAGRAWSALSAAGSLINNAATPSEQYRERFGIGQQSHEDLGTVKGFAKDFGVRTLGYASDLGNALTFGQAGKGYRDLNKNENQPKTRPVQKNVTNPFVDQPSEKPSEKPNIDQQLNQSMYPESQVKTNVRAQSDPYEIKQVGNSFSYSNSQAAAEARSQGIPETQSVGAIKSTYDPVAVQNLMNNTANMGPSQEMIEREMANLQSQSRSFGLRYPNRPVRDDAQSIERANLLRSITQPIAGARGLTSSQRSQLAELQNGEDTRAVQMYNTDANNSTSMATNSANNAASIAQTMMREQGANQRTMLNEQGQNSRFGAGLNLDALKLKANNDLDNRKFEHEQKKEGFGIRNSERIEKLNEMYDKAETNEQRQSILDRINRLTGAKGTSGKDRYMTVGGGQEWDQEAGAMVNRPQQIFDTQNQQLVNLGVVQQKGNQAMQKFKDYQVVEDANGNRAYVLGGKFIPIPH